MNYLSDVMKQIGSRTLYLVGLVEGIVQSILLLAFRSYWGWLFVVTGYGKLMNHYRVTDFFTSLGIPAPGVNAWFVGGVECVGGALLLVGFMSRPIALLLAGNMLVAYLSVTADRDALFGVLSDPGPFLQADAFFFLLTSLLVLAFGPGLVSVDAGLTWLLRDRSFLSGFSELILGRIRVPRTESRHHRA